VFNEQRQSPRKVFKVKAVVAIEGEAPLAVRTVDIGSNGLCVSSPAPIQVGQDANVRFELFFEGKATPIDTRCKAVYCVFSNGEFKVGFQFLQLALADMTRLAKFLR
jgi:hypothetical protein